MNECSGNEALSHIAKQWALHDGTIRELRLFRSDEYEVALEMTCEPRAESPVSELRLRFGGVYRFELVWEREQSFFFVPSYKALVLSNGDIYLSLDPYDEHSSQVDERDCAVVVARTLIAEFVHRT